MSSEHDEIERCLKDFLAITHATHKRQCALRQGVRECDPSRCTHENWDIARNWCNDCGVGKWEILVNPEYGASH